MLRELLSNRTVQASVVFIVLMGVGSLLYLQHVERENARDLARSFEQARRYEERRQRAQQEAASAVPETDGHWHGDAHPPNSDGDAHSINDGEAHPPNSEEPEAPPTLTRDELPEALPYPMTQSNRHVWDALVTEAAEDAELMQKLLPDTKEKAHETATHLSNSFADFELKTAFEMAMWRKLAALYPNDAEVLILATIYMPYGPRASRAEKEAYVDIWERIKRLNDEQGIPLTSGLRKTPNLSQTYIDLGEYDKALQNIQEQLEWIAEQRRAGLSHRTMHYGLLGSSGLARALELKKEHEAKQDK